MKFSKSDIEKLSGKHALHQLLAMDKPDFNRCLEIINFEKELKELQTELIKVQEWVIKNNKRVLVIVEGGEFAGKSDLIRAMSYHLNPRSLRTVALPKPSPLELHQWYFRRYVKQMPQKAEIVLFDRSWYNRAVLEPVNGFCTKEEYSAFMNEVNQFEQLITSNELILIKIYLKISKNKQAERLQDVRLNPLRYWELTEVDKRAQELWDDFKKYENRMLKKTSTEKNPWLIINGDNKMKAQLSSIKHILKSIPYKRKPR